MTYFHVVRDSYYKKGHTFSTSDINWGKSVLLQRSSGAVCNEIFNVSKRSGASIGELVDLCSYFHRSGNLDASIASYRAHGGISLSNDDIGSFFNFFMSKPVIFETEQDGLELWEHLYESVRKSLFLKAPSRLQSCFSFSRLPEAKRFRTIKSKRLRADFLICGLEPLDKFTPMPYDRTLIDEIDISYDYGKAERALIAYWSRERSSKPVIEYLMQGKLRYGMQFGH